MPTSVGPDGTIESGYGWYGGVYGWGFSACCRSPGGEGGPPRLPLAHACTALATPCC